mmetsp:Transcript_20133/g.58220  ORF Transcript_20133/g.58220 Transcript_20133/m.58220 type:complete len:102 (-) Transcript_20133:402-707(-)
MHHHDGGKEANQCAYGGQRGETRVRKNHANANEHQPEPKQLQKGIRDAITKRRQLRILVQKSTISTLLILPLVHPAVSGNFEGSFGTIKKAGFSFQEGQKR